MGINKLDRLYRDVVLDHSKYPRRYNKVIEVTHHMEVVNASCGDVLTVELCVKDGMVIDAAFKGHGCSISQASASMMMETILNQPLAKVSEKITVFLDMVQGKASGNELDDAQVMRSVQQFPTRIKCATLAWKALEAMMKNQLLEEENDE